MSAPCVGTRSSTFNAGTEGKYWLAAHDTPSTIATHGEAHETRQHQRPALEWASGHCSSATNHTPAVIKVARPPGQRAPRAEPESDHRWREQHERSSR